MVVELLRCWGSEGMIGWVSGGIAGAVAVPGFVSGYLLVGLGTLGGS